MVAIIAFQHGADLCTEDIVVCLGGWVPISTPTKEFKLTGQMRFDAGQAVLWCGGSYFKAPPQV